MTEEEMPGQTNADIPETGAIFAFGKSCFADNVSSHFWLKNGHPVDISCGKEHSALITGNGRLFMFGINTSGQLGLKTKPAVNKPTSVKALKSEKVKLVACGRDHTLVCTFHHCIYGAGRNQRGKLGLSNKKKTKSFQMLHLFEPARVKMLAAGSNTSAALTEDGRLFMWGDNSMGQIGLGEEVFAAEPRELSVGQAVMWVSCGQCHSAFVTVLGGLYTFGESANGRLGLQEEQLSNHRVPQQVQGIMGSVIQVSCGGEHTVVLTVEDVYTFGRGQYGQLGHGTFQFELHLPKPLEHFHDGSARRIACGENHTAVITKSGQLYMFGDGRYGKLGLHEENYINQFSPTLCCRFLKYSVKSVSCGSDHTLVLAVPRAAALSQGKVCFWESEESENVLKDSFMDPAAVVPLSALAARARHREKKSFMELFGELPHHPLRLNSGFLSTFWQTSRTIQNQKLHAPTPTSSPKAATASKLLSPRSESLSSRCAVLSSNPSSPRSQSSYSCESKASTAAPSRSKPKKLPSPASSSTSFATHNPNSPFHGITALKRTAGRAEKNKNALNDKPSDASPPNKPCSPNRPLYHVADKRLNQKGPQTDQESPKRQLIPQDVDDGNHEDFLPYKENKSRTIKTAKDPERHEDQDSGQNLNRDLKKGLLTGFISKKNEASSQKSKRNKTKETSADQQNINVRKEKNLEGNEAQKKIYKFKSAKHEKTNSATQVNSKYDEDQVTEPSFGKGLTVTPKRKKILSASDKTSPTLKFTDSKETSSFKSTNNGTKQDVVIQDKSNNQKPAGVRKQQGSKRPRSTSAKEKVESSEGNLQSSAVLVTKTSQAASVYVKSTPFKRIKPKHDKNRTDDAKKSSAGSKRIKGNDKNGLMSSENMNGGVKSKTFEKQKFPPKKEEDELKVKKRDETKRGKEKGTDMDSECNSKAKARIRKTETSSLLSSHREEASEISSDAASLQSPKTTNGLSVSRAKSVQSSDRAAAEIPAPGTESKELEGLHERKEVWEDILSNAASLLPAAGIAGAAIGLISEAATHAETFLADGGRAAKLKAQQDGKKSAIMHPSFSSTIMPSDSEEGDENTQRNAQISILSNLGNSAHEEEINDPSEQEQSEETGSKESVKNKCGEEESFEDQDPNKIKRNTGDENHKEYNVDRKNKEEEIDSSTGLDAAEERGPGEEDEEQDSQSEEEGSEGKTSSSIQGGSRESNQSDTKDTECQKEESSVEIGEEVSHSEESKAAEEDEGRSQEQSDEESKEENDSAVSGDEEAKSSDGSEGEHCESEEEDEEQDGEEGDFSVSGRSEEKEEYEESWESDEDQETEKEESEEEDYGDENSEQEEEGELSANDDEETHEEEGEGDEESAGEENEVKNKVETESDEDEALVEENEEEEKVMKEYKRNMKRKEERNSASEEDEDEDGHEEEEEENEDTGKESKKSEDEEEDDEEGEEEEEENEEVEEDDETQHQYEQEEEEGDEEQIEGDEEEENQTEEDEEIEESTEDDEEGEEEGEEEEEGDKEEKEEEEEVQQEEEEEDEGEEEEEQEDEGEEKEDEGEEEEDEGEEEEEEEEDEGEEEEDEGEEEEEEEEDEGEEEEEEKEEVQEAEKKKEKKRKSITKRGRKELQNLAPAASSSSSATGAPRLRAAEEKKPEESQQFWNNVLPQYLDLQ